MFGNHKEEVRIQKKNGDVFGPYNAKVAGEVIILLEPKADVEKGDYVLRKLPNSKDEKKVITACNFYSQNLTGYGPHFQLKCKDESEIIERQPVQNFHFNNSNVQVGDGNTQNIIKELEDKIDKAQATPQEKEEAKGLLWQLMDNKLVNTVVGTLASNTFKGE